MRTVDYQSKIFNDASKYEKVFTDPKYQSVGHVGGAGQGVNSTVEVPIGRQNVQSDAITPADAVVKAYRRLYYEGITSETVGGNASITTQFVSDILAEYEDEIEAYRAMHGGDDGGEGRVRFL